MNGDGLGDRLDAARRWADAELERALGAVDGAPERLVAAMRHALLAGGKRLRPALVRIVCEELGGAADACVRPAVAIELVHTYSLVHDDLPCMDDDELRRGQPTVHVAFDEATAVLVGDAFLTLAFEVLGDAPGERAGAFAGVLARAAGATGMVGGQELDLHAGERGVDVDLVTSVHARKTAALFGAAAELGVLAAGGEADVRARGVAFGCALGLLFQASDDLLDVTGDAATLGKTPGKDAALERATLVALLGPDGARVRASELAAEAVRTAGALAGGPDGALAALVRRLAERRS